MIDTTIQAMIDKVNQDLHKKMMGAWPMPDKKPSPTPETIGGRPTLKPQPGHPPYVSRIEPSSPDCMTVQFPDGTSAMMLAKDVKAMGFFPKAVNILSSKMGPDSQAWHEVRVELFKGQTGEVWVSDKFLKEHGWDDTERLPAKPADVPRWSLSKEDPLKELSDFFAMPHQLGTLMTDDQLAATTAKSFNEGFDLAKKRGQQDLETNVRIESEKAFRAGAAEATKGHKEGQRQLWETLKQAMRTDVRMMGLSAETQKIIDLVLQEAAISYKVEGMIQALSSMSADSQRLGYEAGKLDAQEEAKVAKAVEDAKKGSLSVPLNVTAFDSKASPQMGPAMVWTGPTAHDHIAAFYKEPKSDKIEETKEVPMDRALSKERLIGSLRDAIHQHKSDSVLEEILKEYEEAAFEAGHDIGYEEGLEDGAEDEDIQQGSEEPEEVKMDLMMRTLDEGSEAGTRLAVKQLIKLIKEPLLAKMAGHLGADDPSMRAKLAGFMETELGEALLMGLLSVALGFVPGSLGQAQLEAMTRELRVSAMTNVGDTVADLLMGPLRQVLSNMVVPTVKPAPALPAEPQQVRVSIPVEVSQPVTVGSKK